MHAIQHQTLRLTRQPKRKRVLILVQRRLFHAGQRIKHVIRAHRHLINQVSTPATPHAPPCVQQRVIRGLLLMVIGVCRVMGLPPTTQMAKHNQRLINVRP